MTMISPTTRRIAIDMPRANKSSTANSKQTPSSFSSSTSATSKMSLLAILLALLIILNLSSSSVVVRSSSSSLRRRRQQQQPSLRKRPREATTQRHRQERRNSSTHREDDRGSTDAAERSSMEGRGRNKGKIAWLMSFPNSGTSFTSLLVRHASNRTTATNYGMESHLGPEGSSVPVYDWSTEGPYWLHPPRRLEANGDGANEGDGEMANAGGYRSGTKLGKSGTYGVPPAYASILTKTHCGGRCASCSPHKYLETSASFLKMCLSGSRKVQRKDDEDRYEKQHFTYHPSLVEKAVHLLRDPFDNIVSRFHHEQKEHRKKGPNAWTSRYSDDAPGFRRWCADEDALRADDEEAVDWGARGHPADLPRKFRGVSCHGEFFRYTRWHVLAARAAASLGAPTLRVHYEDYATDLEGTAGRLLDFLGLDDAGGGMPRFDSGKDYSAYFTREERAAASDLMRSVASDGVEELLERYWVELDFEKLRKQTRNLN